MPSGTLSAPHSNLGEYAFRSQHLPICPQMNDVFESYDNFIGLVHIPGIWLDILTYVPAVKWSW